MGEGSREVERIAWKSVESMDARLQRQPVAALVPPSQMGRLLGEADAAVMVQLLSMGVFSR